MALRNQPYIPLYVQDLLTDEKLMLCSASAHGVYLRLMCILHKQKKYGVLSLNDKQKQTSDKHENFSNLLRLFMPFQKDIIKEAIMEMEEHEVIKITDCELSQKRMVRDGELSEIRANCGKSGGNSVTKQYGKEGFLYWIGDFCEKNKIGISLNPQNRLYRLRSDMHLKNLEIQDFCKVLDMGKAEDDALLFFKDYRDGEWLILNHEETKEKFALIKAKLEAK